DVARMIRDLRYQEVESRTRSRWRMRLALILILISAATAGVILREQELAQRYALIPAAMADDLASHDARLAAVEQLQSSAIAWHGMFQVDTERSALRREIDRLVAREAQRRSEQRELENQRRVRASAARERGLLAVQNQDLSSALV